MDVEQRQEISEVVGYLDLLEPHHRELLTFKFIHDMSIADIADVLQISENATSVRLHRALEHARKKLSFLYE
jgi:RNA polymerase sigma factor (sigma-70 family)